MSIHMCWASWGGCIPPNAVGGNIQLASGTSLAGLLSPPKCNNFLRVDTVPLSESRPLIPHYLGELMAFQVKWTFNPTLHSMWVTAMLSIMAWVPHRVVVTSLRKRKDFWVSNFRDLISKVDCYIGRTLFAGSDQWGSIPYPYNAGHSGALLHIVSRFPRLIVSATSLFSLLATEKFNNDFKKEGVSCWLSWKESSQLLCGLQAKPATRVKIPKAMRIRGYSQSKAVDCWLSAADAGALQGGEN